MNVPDCVLSLNAVNCGYPQNPLINQLSLDCYRGDILAILGTNGRGKTTLLHTLMGLLPVLSGSIVSNCKIGFVPQIFTSAFAYQVLDIVLMGRAQQIGIFGTPSQHDIDIAESALASLGISALATQDFNRLSGGQQQLVLIARALASECQLLILDEPTTALDLHNQDAVLGLMHRLAKEHNLSILFTTHDPAHAQAIADRCLLLMDNHQHVLGARDEMLTEDNLSQLYHLAVKKVEIAEPSSSYTTWVPTYRINSRD